MVIMNKRTREYHSLKKVKDAIRNENYYIEDELLEQIHDSFGWDINDIEKAFLKLQPKHWNATEKHWTLKNTWVDHYKGKILSENIYTHFHFENDQLQIVSFKRQ